MIRDGTRWKTYKGDAASKQAARGRAASVKRGSCCERCGHDGSESRLERHHRDRDPYNNAHGNLELLCRSCHVTEHTKGPPVQCKHGHALTPDRVYWYTHADGRRSWQCKDCKSAAVQRCKARGKVVA